MTADFQRSRLTYADIQGPILLLHLLFGLIQGQLTIYRSFHSEIEELKQWKDRETAGLPIEWLPPSLQPPAPPALLPPPPPDPDAEDYEPARPAWRTVHKRADRKKKQKAITGGGPASPSPPPQTPPPMGGMPGGFAMPSWAQWRPNPVYSPAPVSASPGSPLPASVNAKPGLFGPPSPGPK
ncbi:hypothetical protein PQX77_010689 [Marasmius sp. AFHP31]|nr:hypothetical protein PQX77_010689 [Marasmius sp. AFHP31]